MWPSTSVLVITGLLLGAPLTTAGWSAFGDHEPSSILDEHTLLWFDAPGAALNRIYFNGWTQTSNGINPNVGALQTSNEVPDQQSQLGMLGVWIDCNSDGYVGMAESALTEYDAALLLDTSICPRGSGTPNSWNGQHNYNGWVSELVPIGHSGGDADDDRRDLRIHRDPTAKVWADAGAPDEAIPIPGRSCAPRPLPPGTTRSTGGLLNHAECSADALARWNDILRDGVTIAGPLGIPAADPSNSLGLHFNDEDDARQAGHPLHQQTFGSDESENALIHTSDCEAPPLIRGGDALDGTPLGPAPLGTGASDITIWRPAPNLGNTNDPTIPGQLNRTNEEREWNSGGCNPMNDPGRDFYAIEAEAAVDPEGGKRGADWNFVFRDSARASVPPWSLIHGGNAGMDSGGGLGPGASWTGPGTAAKPGGPRTVRAELGLGTIAPAPAEMLTYYAYVGSATTSRGFITPGGAGSYGSGQCGGSTSGVHSGWNCAHELWYLNLDGTAQTEAEGGNARPGDPYVLRDVDCRDGRNELDIPTGFPAYFVPCP